YVNLSENGSAASLNFSVQDSSPPAAGVTVTFGGQATNNFVSATASISGLGGTVTLSPKPNVFGTNTLTIFVSDGLGTSSADVQGRACRKLYRFGHFDPDRQRQSRTNRFCGVSRKCANGSSAHFC